MPFVTFVLLTSSRLPPDASCSREPPVLTLSSDDDDDFPSPFARCASVSFFLSEESSSCTKSRHVQTSDEINKFTVNFLRGTINQFIAGTEFRIYPSTSFKLVMQHRRINESVMGAKTRKIKLLEIIYRGQTKPNTHKICSCWFM